MNDDATDYATNLPVTLDNEATQYDAVFAFATPAATTVAAVTIFPNTHLLSSGIKLDTELF